MVVNNMLVDSLCSSLNTLSLGSLSLQEIIKIKKERRLAENRLRDAVEEQGRQRWHGNRRSRQCPNNARAQRAESANARLQGRQTRTARSANPDFVPQPCPSCNSTEHSSTRSKLCPFHSNSTDELLEEAVGKNFERFTRKCPFESVVRSTYRPPLHDAVIKLSGYLRSVVIRSHILANAYLLDLQGNIPPLIFFSQNCFYTVMQIVLNKPVTTTNRFIPVDALQNIWTSFTRQHPSLNSPPQITLRRSVDVLTEAAVTLATTYSNHIVLNFEQQVKNYLKYKISANFPTLKNALVWRLIEKYALPRIATGDGDWPEDWPEDVSLIMVATVDYLCSQLESLIPRPLNQETLSASPGEYIPALKFMLRDLEFLFSIGPLPFMGWRFISLTAGLLASILPSIRAPQSPSDYINVFYEIFDIQPLRIRSLDELRLKNHKFAFARRILTDGHAVNFLFARKRDAEIATYFEVAAIDPGRTQVFTAAYGSGQERHQLRRCSTSEYYSMTGSKRRNQKWQQEKKEAGILRIEESWPTGKTCNIRQYQSYVAHLLNNFDELSKFYDISRGKMRFDNFQGVQRSREEMANMLVNGGKKYSKSRRKNTPKNRRLRRRHRKNRKTKKISEKWSQICSSDNAGMELSVRPLVNAR
ncbi:hypothetical protein BGW37DRAFT_473671 [Umbelopsis sp. PMI_123]|nr:hypothetical protein BGW37DRAFT_473671 [Umbelopsis sp. PMI_123]